MRVLVTGAKGFVGSHLIQHLSGCGIETIGSSRRPVGESAPGRFVIAGPDARIGEHLGGVDVVIHAAGVAHRSADYEEEMMEGNARWTERIVKSVIDSEVKALVHISSIAAVEGGNAYGRSKLLAEESVNELAVSGKTGINLRPPLIYGNGAKGNWPKLVGLAKSPIPLPFASVKNQRSFMGISNLCELLRAILDRCDHPELSGTYPVADDDLVSLEEIIRTLRNRLGRGAGMFPFPVAMLDGLLRRTGKATMADGLFRDLRIDASEVKKAFGWNPTTPTLEGMADSLFSKTPVWV